MIQCAAGLALLYPCPEYVRNAVLALGEVLGEYRMKMKRRVWRLNCGARRFCCIKTMIRLIFEKIA